MHKGISIDECVMQATEIIKKEGMCLLLFDMKESKKSPDPQTRVQRLTYMMQDLNKAFTDYFPTNNLAVSTRKEKGFQVLLGDGSFAAINSAHIIPAIVEYQRRHFPDIELYWGVAQDGYDDKRVALLK